MAATEVSKSENLIRDSSSLLDQLDQQPLDVQDLKEHLMVSEDEVVQVLTREDNTHKFIEDLLWKIQIEEREKRMATGINNTHLHTIREALGKMKSDYLKLLKDRDFAIKFAENGEEVDELCLQLSMMQYKLSKSENQNSTTATLKEEEANLKSMEMMQIIEGINTIGRDETIHNVPAICCTNDNNEEQKDQQGNKPINFDVEKTICSNEMAVATRYISRFQSGFNNGTAATYELSNLEEVMLQDDDKQVFTSSGISLNGDLSMGEKFDFIDDTYSESDFQELSVLGSEGIHTSFLRLSSFSLDRAALYLLLGDFIIFDFLWTGGCSRWDHVAFPDFSLSTSMIQWSRSVEGCFFLIETECGLFYFDWHWFGHMFEIIYVAGQSYGSEIWYPFVLVYRHEGVHLLFVWLSYMHGWLPQGDWLANSFIAYSRFYRLIWDPGSDMFGALTLVDQDMLLHHGYADVLINVEQRIS